MAEQQAEMLKEWGAESLLEDHSKKVIDVQQMDDELEAQSKSGAKALLNKEDIELKTELTPIEVMAASRLLFVADRYDIQGIDQFMSQLLQLKVSQNRKGRREFIEGLHAEERRQTGSDLSPIASALNKIGL